MILHLYWVTNRLRSQLHFLHVTKDAKPQTIRALLASADDELIEANNECTINTLDAIHKLTKVENCMLKKYKNCIRALVNPKICYKKKRKRLVQWGMFILPMLANVLSGVIGAVINNNN